MVVVVKIKYETHTHEKKKNYERRTRVILVVHVCMWISRYSHIEFVHNIFIYKTIKNKKTFLLIFCGGACESFIIVEE